MQGHVTPCTPAVSKLIRLFLQILGKVMGGSEGMESKGRKRKGKRKMDGRRGEGIGWEERRGEGRRGEGMRRK